ncbi:MULTISPECIES: hypothetical protein [Cytobacillus]|uniref:Uncharacterized protein n=1 Tax=Cytobacillus horneckiae TaxID=549687 RepID=A0A2N0ZN20_9BACI|nr:hypothetical protein [Cytobacillus horneckiae]MEC1157706.1 hypothetical protein [Cytobacillus horneckiae]PKG30898.1 hypothetical protein CWS20_00970 [Cytobacillus horneckiae]
MKRKARIGIVTNKMSEQVYNHLEQKAQTNELSQYIISLVEKDLQNSFLQDQFFLVKSELEEMHSTINKMKKVFRQNEEVNVLANDETLVNLEVVSDEEVSKSGFEESVEMDF